MMQLRLGNPSAPITHARVIRQTAGLARGAWYPVSCLYNGHWVLIADEKPTDIPANEVETASRGLIEHAVPGIDPAGRVVFVCPEGHHVPDRPGARRGAFCKACRYRYLVVDEDGIRERMMAAD